MKKRLFLCILLVAIIVALVDQCRLAFRPGPLGKPLTVLWTRQYFPDTVAWDVALDETGNAYVIGATGRVRHAFILKYDGSGNQLWALELGQASEAHDVAVDAAGNAYVVGSMRGMYGTLPDGPAIMFKKLSWASMTALGRSCGQTSSAISTGTATLPRVSLWTHRAMRI